MELSERDQNRPQGQRDREQRERDRIPPVTKLIEIKRRIKKDRSQANLDAELRIDSYFGTPLAMCDAKFQQARAVPAIARAISYHRSRNFSRRCEPAILRISRVETKIQRAIATSSNEVTSDNAALYPRKAP
jgi:hypothetical protein